MKKTVWGAAVFVSAVLIFTCIGCSKSPEALAKETIRLEQLVLETATDTQKAVKIAQDTAAHLQEVEKLSEINREKYETALAALVLGVPADSVPPNPIRGTRWTGADDETMILEFDRAVTTFKITGDEVSYEGTYELITGVNIGFDDGDTDTGKLSGDTLEFYGVTFKKKSGNEILDNTKWEATLEDNSISLNFAIDRFTFSTENQSTENITMEGTFNLFYVINLSLSDGSAEELILDGNTLKNSWDDVIFNKSSSTVSTQTKPAAAPASTPRAPTQATTAPAATSVPASSGTNWDSLLDQYEKFVDDYIAAMEKAAAGDFTAMTTALSLMEDAESLSDRLENASNEISAAQSARFLRIQTKLVNAASL